MTIFKQLSNIINSPRLSFAMESHNALSAKIVESAGFEVIWASGLSISATMGLADRNEASWTQVLDIIELMADHVNIPILMDADSGFGDFNNVRRLAKKTSQKGIAGFSLEDKLFPKCNSFIGANQKLEDVGSFVSKIKAAKDSAIDSNFCVVARTETLISGLSMNEALDRAHAYFQAGADAILIHSKANTAHEVHEFCERWENRCPVIVVPTTYSNTPVEEFASRNVSLAIWANQNIRASVKAMRELTSIVKNKSSISCIEKNICSVKDLFSLTTEPAAKKAIETYS